MGKYLDDRLTVGIILGITTGLYFPQVAEFKALLVLVTLMIVGVHLVTVKK